MSKDRKYTKQQIAIIRRKKIEEAAQCKQYVGKIYRGVTKYIDPDTKRTRDYVVVRENGKKVTVSKVKSIKQVDENEKNADKALVEINHERYSLPKRSGVDFQRFDTNIMSGKPLKITDNRVFPEGKSRAELSNRDKERVLIHTGIKNPNRRKKKK